MDWTKGNMIHKMRSYISILTLLLFQNIAHCQGSPFGYGELFSILKDYVEHREHVAVYEKRLKGMSSMSGYRYVTITNDNAKRAVNARYDTKIQKALAKYSLTLRDSVPETHESELSESKGYKIYMKKVIKIEHRRNKDLQHLEEQYNYMIKVYSPYWSRNDRYGKKYLE